MSASWRGSAAGVHAAGNGRAVLSPLDLLHGQGVHVGAQQDRAAVGSRGPQPADHAGAADARPDLDTESGQRRLDDAGGAMLLEAELRMAVQVAAPRTKLRLQVGNGLLQVGVGHGTLLGAEVSRSRSR